MESKVVKQQGGHDKIWSVKVDIFFSLTQSSSTSEVCVFSVLPTTRKISFLFNFNIPINVFKVKFKVPYP